MKKLFKKINETMLVDEGEEVSLHDLVWFYGGSVLAMSYPIIIWISTRPLSL